MKHSRQSKLHLIFFEHAPQLRLEPFIVRIFKQGAGAEIIGKAEKAGFGSFG